MTNAPQDETDVQPPQSTFVQVVGLASLLLLMVLLILFLWCWILRRSCHRRASTFVSFTRDPTSLKTIASETSGSSRAPDSVAKKTLARSNKPPSPTPSGAQGVS